MFKRTNAAAVEPEVRETDDSLARRLRAELNQCAETMTELRQRGWAISEGFHWREGTHYTASIDISRHVRLSTDDK